MMHSNTKDYWPAVGALTLGIAALMMAQFLPSGLLTPMAKTFQVSEGLAGQTVTVTSLFAMVISLFISYLTRGFNRRYVLIGLSLLTLVSCLLTALSTSFLGVILARAVLGVAIGGYWSMATAITIKLLSKEQAPKGIALVFGGASFAGMLAAPLGSFLGKYIGWQDVFLINAAIAVLGLLWLIISMPALAPQVNIRVDTIFKLLKSKMINLGLLAILTAFYGRYASLTYLRPFVENTMLLDTDFVTILFAVFDVSYFIGTFFAAKLIKQYTYQLMYLPQLILALASFMLIFSKDSFYLVLISMLFSGLAFANIPISWSSWGPRRLPDHAESIGGLFVCATQFSSMFGALLGGIIYDYFGGSGVFLSSGVIWGLSAIIVLYFMQKEPNN